MSKKVVKNTLAKSCGFLLRAAVGGIRIKIRGFHFLSGKKPSPLYLRIFLAIGAVILILLTGALIFYRTHTDFSANFADYVLRPLVGTQITLKMEAVLFTLEDEFNQIKYHFFKPDQKVFSDIHLSNVASESAFTLTPIPIEKGESGEGVWSTISVDGNTPLLAQTFLHPDPERSYAVVALVKMNMGPLAIGVVAGTWEPGEAAKRGPGKVPTDIQKTNDLIAAFNGGFQKKDGAYGMIVGNEVYLPLQKNLATLVMYTNATPKLFRYTGQKLDKTVIAVRQNGPMLIENGKIVTSSNAWNMQTWGLTTTNSMYTWRSGLGITKNGDLIYAVGSSLVPETLAAALLKAGAVQAMQLDINPVWVRYVLYHSTGDGRYTYQMLLKDMSDGGLSYLSGYQKDFFYVYKTSQKAQANVQKMPLTIFTTPSPHVYANSKNP